MKLALSANTAEELKDQLMAFAECQVRKLDQIESEQDLNSFYQALGQWLDEIIICPRTPEARPPSRKRNLR